MKSFLLFLCLAAAEKLDRTYLPPPGSKFSGGIPGDIQVPFETPKETYSTTSGPDVYKNGVLSPEDIQIDIGINRGVKPRPGNVITSGDQRPFDYYQNTYKVPTTTTSYAFTSTTTHPPNEAQGTTIGHINPVTGRPTTAFDLPTTIPSFTNPEANNQGNQEVQYQQTQQPGPKPIYGPSQYPTTSSLAPGSQFIEQNRPGFQGNNYDFVQNRQPVFTPGITQRPGINTAAEDLSRPSLTQGNNYNLIENQRPSFQPGSTQRPSYSQGQNLPQYQGNRYPVNVPVIGQNNDLVPSTFAPDTTPSTVQYGGDLDHGIISNQNIPFSQGNIPSKPVNISPGPIYSGQQASDFNVTSGQQVTQQGPYGKPGQTQHGSNQGASTSSQYLVSQTDELGRPVNQNNNIYKPILPISDSNQYFGTTPGPRPSATTVYPTTSYHTTPINPVTGNQIISSDLIPRPERPQAESDRNAVILNYENVITPEGFAYSFDTSNGIHADESGTAVDGVKAKGSYSYIGDDGKLYSIVYTADENGFIPHGDHLPTSPPIPEAIQKVIEQAKKDQEDGISDDGTYDEDKYGHMKYHSKKPQRPNRINPDREFSKIYNSQYSQTNQRTQNTPQGSKKVPVSSNQADYNDDFENEQSYDGKRPINYDPKQKLTTYQSLSKRPGKISENNYQEYDTQITDETTDETTDKGIKYGPTARPSDRRQFGGKISIQRPIQYVENNRNNLRPDQESTLKKKYPDAIETEEQYYVDDDNRKPTENKYIQRLGEKLGNTQDYKDDLGDNENINNSTDIPSNLSDDEQKEYDSKVLHDKIPTQRPGQSSNNSRVPTATDSFEERFGNRIRPINYTTRPDDQLNYNYQDSRRPGSKNKYLPDKRYPDQPVSSSATGSPISSQFIGSPIVVMQQGLETMPEQSNYQTSNKIPSNIPSDNYDLSQSNTFDSTGSPVFGKGDGPSLSNQYSSSRGRPQSSTIAVPRQDNKYYINRIIKPGVSKVSDINLPIPDRRPGVNRYTTVAPTKEVEGYQYLPPQRKFEHGSQLPQSFETHYYRPSQERTHFIKEEVAKPFTTPDASRDEDDYDHTLDNNQYKTPQYSQVQPNMRPPTTSSEINDKFNKENSPVYDNVTSQRRPNEDLREKAANDMLTTFDSTRTYPTTSRPQHRPAISVYGTKGTPINTLRPQEGERYYDRDGNEIFYLPSTPSPSQTTQIEVTQPTTLQPDKQNIGKFNGVNDHDTTDQRFFPTMTKSPAQRPGSFTGRPVLNVYETTPSQIPYQTTYRPMLTVTSGVDSDEKLGTTIRPDTVPFRRPGYTQSQAPSTTYRPAFFPSKTVTENQITVDKFGRPVPNTEFGSQQEYRPGFSVTPENISPFSQTSQRPQVELKPSVDIYGRPTLPFGGSTTEKIVGEDFSGPKQVQKFDPERGYYY